MELTFFRALEFLAIKSKFRFGRNGYLWTSLLIVYHKVQNLGFHRDRGIPKSTQSDDFRFSQAFFRGGFNFFKTVLKKQKRAYL